MYEIALFKQCLANQTFNVIRQLQLPNIYQTLIQLALQRPHISIEHLAIDTLTKAEALTQNYTHNAMEEKNKLTQSSHNHKNLSLFEKKLNLILKREEIIKQRSHSDITQKLLILESYTTTTPQDGDNN